jgi:putative membrane protein
MGTSKSRSHTDPYSRFDRVELILRDELALDRTLLANERTLLAYLRTGIALMLAGVTFLHFAEAMWFSIVGVVCLVVGILVFPLAVGRFRRLQEALAPLRFRMCCTASDTMARDDKSTDEVDHGCDET